MGGPGSSLGNAIAVHLGDQHRAEVGCTGVDLGNDQVTQHVVFVQCDGLIVGGRQRQRRGPQQPGCTLGDFVVFTNGHQAGGA